MDKITDEYLESNKFQLKNELEISEPDNHYLHQQEQEQSPSTNQLIIKAETNVLAADNADNGNCSNDFRLTQSTSSSKVDDERSSSNINYTNTTSTAIIVDNVDGSVVPKMQTSNLTKTSPSAASTTDRTEFQSTSRSLLLSSSSNLQLHHYQQIMEPSTNIKQQNISSISLGHQSSLSLKSQPQQKKKSSLLYKKLPFTNNAESSSASSRERIHSNFIECRHRNKNSHDDCSEDSSNSFSSSSSDSGEEDQDSSQKIGIKRLNPIESSTGDVHGNGLLNNASITNKHNIDYLLHSLLPSGHSLSGADLSPENVNIVVGNNAEGEEEMLAVASATTRSTPLIPAQDVPFEDPIEIRGNGNMTLFGLSNCYQSTFPSALLGRVSREEFEYTINRINHLLQQQHSTNAKFLLLGCLCCCFSLGCSLLWPTFALSRRTKCSLEKLLSMENSRLYNKLGLNWRLTKQPSHTNHSFMEYILVIDFLPKMHIYQPD